MDEGLADSWTLDAQRATCHYGINVLQASHEHVQSGKRPGLVVAALTGGPDAIYLRIHGAALKTRWLFFFWKTVASTLR